MDVKDATVQLGQGELYADLENAILGMRPGETKKATIKLPEDYGDADLAGKDVEFTITLGDLKHLDVPALDDEFAKDLELESADALRTNVRQHLEARATDLSRQKLEGAVLDKLLEMHPFEVPPAMVDQVIDSMIQELQHPSEEERNKALRSQELRQHFLPQARRRTQNTLILWHVTQKEKLQVTDDEVKSRLDATIASMGLNDPKQLGRIRKQLEPRIRENMIFEKAMNFLIDNAAVTETPASL
jgi:trigger factor